MPLPKQHGTLMNDLRFYMVGEISLDDGLFPVLRQYELITKFQEKRLKNTHHSEVQRAEDLLSDMEKKDGQMLKTFIQCLRVTEQHELVRRMEKKARELGIPEGEYKHPDADKLDTPAAGEMGNKAAWRGLLQKYHVLWLKHLDVGRIQPYMYQAKIFNPTEMEELDRRPAYEKPTTFLKILEHKTENDFQKFIEILRNLDYEDLVPEELGGKTGDNAWRDALQKYHIMWLENIDVDECQPSMYQEGIFDDGDLAELDDCPRQQKPKVFLRILSRKPQNGFYKFLKVLHDLDKDYLIPKDFRIQIQGK